MREIRVDNPKRAILVVLIAGCAEQPPVDSDSASPFVDDVASDADALQEPAFPPYVCGEEAPPLMSSGLMRFDDGYSGWAVAEHSGTSVYGVRTTASISGGTFASELVERDLLNGAESVVDGGIGVVAPLDARDGAILYGVFGMPRRMGIDLFYRDSVSQEPELLFRGAQGLVDAPTLLPWPSGRDAARRSVERGAALWGEGTTNDFSGTNKVRMYHQRRVETLWESASETPYALYLRAGRALWTTTQGNNLWLGMPDTPAVQLTQSGAGHPVLTRDAAWWVEDHVLVRYDLETDEKTIAWRGPCGELVADDYQVAGLCDPEVEESTEWFRGPGRIVVFDGTKRTELDLRNGGAMNIQLVGRRVLWAEYPPGVGGCDDPGEGELVLGNLETPSMPLSIAKLAAGKWICDEQRGWGGLELVLTEEAAIWNYPLTNPRDELADGHALIGFALFEHRCE